MWGAVPRGDGRGEAGQGVRVHVELITYLQLLVGHGGQSCHVEVVEAGAHVHLGILGPVAAPHGQALRSRGGEKAAIEGT